MPTPSRRRWFQFSLASLLWMIVAVALTTVLIMEYREQLLLKELIHILNYEQTAFTSGPLPTSKFPMTTPVRWQWSPYLIYNTSLLTR